MTCSLCNTKKSVIIRRYLLSELRTAWQKGFGFDPFPVDMETKDIQKKQCSKCDLIYFSPPYYGDGDFYARLSKYSWYYEENKWEYDVAASIVSKLTVSKMLEIGCGNGYFLDKIASLDMESHGVDINRDAVDSCQAKGLNAKVVDVFDLKESYDLVVSFEVLEHMDNPDRLFEFLSEKLVAPGGHLIIAVPNPNGYLKDIDMNLLDMPPHHNSSWSLSSFEYVASQYGFKLVDYQKEPLRYVHYLAALNNILTKQEKLTPNTLKSKFVLKLQRLVLQVFAPLKYLEDKDRIEGQTHLVVLKNER